MQLRFEITGATLEIIQRRAKNEVVKLVGRNMTKQERRQMMNDLTLSPVMSDFSGEVMYWSASVTVDVEAKS